MKKLLSILAISLPVITTSFNVVSCKKNDNGNDNTFIPTEGKNVLKGENYATNSDGSLDLTDENNKIAIMNTIGMDELEQEKISSITGNLEIDNVVAPITFTSNSSSFVVNMKWISEPEITNSEENVGFKSVYSINNYVYAAGVKGNLYISDDYGASYALFSDSSITDDMEYIGEGINNNVLLETIGSSNISMYLIDDNKTIKPITINVEGGGNISNQEDIIYYDGHYVISTDSGIYYSKDGINSSDNSISFTKYWDSNDVANIVGFEKNGEDYLMGSASDNEQIMAPISNLDTTTSINTSSIGEVDDLASNGEQVACIIDGGLYYLNSDYNDWDLYPGIHENYGSLEVLSYVKNLSGNETSLIMGNGEGEIININGDVIIEKAGSEKYFNQLPDKTLISGSEGGSLIYFINNK